MTVMALFQNGFGCGTPPFLSWFFGVRPGSFIFLSLSLGSKSIIYRDSNRKRTLITATPSDIFVLHVEMGGIEPPCKRIVRLRLQSLFRFYTAEWKRTKLSAGLFLGFGLAAERRKSYPEDITLKSAYRKSTGWMSLTRERKRKRGIPPCTAREFPWLLQLF